MNQILKVSTKTGLDVVLTLKKLDVSYIDQIMKLENLVYDALEDKSFYGHATKEEYLEVLKHNGTILGCLTNEDELVAMGSYMAYGLSEHNYGYDIGLKDDDLFTIGQIQATVVAPSYRGNKLQHIICTALEDIAKAEGKKLISATAHPLNKYSVNTFMKLGYEVKADKLKYGGLRRYVLVKPLSK